MIMNCQLGNLGENYFVNFSNLIEIGRCFLQGRSISCIGYYNHSRDGKILRNETAAMV